MAGLLNGLFLDIDGCSLSRRQLRTKDLRDGWSDATHVDTSYTRLKSAKSSSEPYAHWTRQQFRAALPGDHAYRYVIHDRDRIFSKEMDKMLEALGVKVLRTPVRAPKANGICERIVRTVRRECLGFLLPSLNPTSDEFFGSGLSITITAVLTTDM